MRVKRGVCARRRHKKILKRAKGYIGQSGNVYRSAVQAVTRAGQYAYRDRRVKKRVFRSQAIMCIDAFVRQHGLTYNRFINLLAKKGIVLNRMILASMAKNDAAALIGTYYQFPKRGYGTPVMDDQKMF